MSAPVPGQRVMVRHARGGQWSSTILAIRPKPRADQAWVGVCEESIATLMWLPVWPGTQCSVTPISRAARVAGRGSCSGRSWEDALRAAILAAEEYWGYDPSGLAEHARLLLGGAP